ncbi:hypothetical protein [Aestuariibacter salexigens]|nr:hypothetical protein [Aestuariibacter salexigens]
MLFLPEQYKTAGQVLRVVGFIDNASYLTLIYAAAMLATTSEPLGEVSK